MYGLLLGLSEDNHQLQHSDVKSHLQYPLQLPNMPSNSLQQQNDLCALGSTNFYSNSPQYNLLLNTPIQSCDTSGYEKAPQSGHASSRGYISTSRQ
ncbi:unnamed protein product [Trichobilharzia szidati]|nr:unnamed protein product [Trichobilharzia szidati]